MEIFTSERGERKRERVCGTFVDGVRAADTTLWWPRMRGERVKGRSPWPGRRETKIWLSLQQTWRKRQMRYEWHKVQFIWAWQFCDGHEIPLNITYMYIQSCTLCKLSHTLSAGPNSLYMSFTDWMWFNCYSLHSSNTYILLQEEWTTYRSPETNGSHGVIIDCAPPPYHTVVTLS